jgi:hypothetical protein
MSGIAVTIFGGAFVKFNLKLFTIDWSVLSVALTWIKSTCGLGDTIRKVLVVGIKKAHAGKGSPDC